MSPATTPTDALRVRTFEGSPRLRWPALLTAAFGTLLSVAGLAWTTPAAAATFPGPVTFSYTGAEQNYSVPAGITLLQIEAVGGNGSPDLNHGVGMDLNVAIPVSPGEVLFAEVGAAGGVSSFGGGAPGAPGAGSGGGASDVRTCSTASPSCPGGTTSLDSRLVVAGGGGGGGGSPAEAYYFGTTCGDYGGGGSASLGTTPVAVPSGTVLPGQDAIGAAPAVDAQGGQATGPGAAGATPDCTGFVADFGGAVSGMSGSGANGGAGAAAVASPPGGGGGGGGGGYFGGGGGASGQTETQPIRDHSASGGGGGAAGASFYSSQVTGDISVGHNGTDTAPSITMMPLISTTSPSNGATYSPGQAVDAAFACQPLVGGCGSSTVPNGTPIDTSTVGPHSFVVSTLNATSTVHYFVGDPPTITSAATTTLTAGHPGSFRITTSPGFPVSLTLSDGGAALPAGVVFKDNADGTATLSGTPHTGSAGSYQFAVTASNGVNPDASQSFTLRVLDVPGAPTGLVALPSNGAIVVSWHAPLRTGGSPLTGYTVKSTPGNASCTTTVALHCTLGSLDPTTWYSLSVNATNAQGDGALSSATGAFASTAASLKMWAVPTVVARGTSFQFGVIGAVPGSAVHVSVPHEPTVSCMADAAGQCRIQSQEARAGIWTLTSSSRGATSSARLHVPLVLAPASATVHQRIAVRVSHCPSGAPVKVSASDGRTLLATASPSGSVTLWVTARTKGALTLVAFVSGVAVRVATVAVS